MSRSSRGKVKNGIDIGTKVIVVGGSGGGPQWRRRLLHRSAESVFPTSAEVTSKSSNACEAMLRQIAPSLT